MLILGLGLGIKTTWLGLEKHHALAPKYQMEMVRLPVKKILFSMPPKQMEISSGFLKNIHWCDCGRLFGGLVCFIGSNRPDEDPHGMKVYYLFSFTWYTGCANNQPTLLLHFHLNTISENCFFPSLSYGRNILHRQLTVLSLLHEERNVVHQCISA